MSASLFQSLTGLRTSNVVITSNTITINDTFYVDPISLKVGNSSSNVVINTSSISIGSVSVNSSTIRVGANLTLNASTFAFGNTSINTTAIVVNSISGNGAGLTSVKWMGASYTISTGSPSGGNDGDFWFQTEA